MQRFYDSEKRRLVYTGEEATEYFWDDHWYTKKLRMTRSSTRRGLRSAIKALLGGSFVVRTTKRYLPPGAAVLEGGCGLAGHVRDLANAGYLVTGVDYAPRTVDLVREMFPYLDVQLGDVRKLPFQDDRFDGYWSWGVIEHFWNGFEEIVSEMARVVRGGGYVFITFPHMSWLRNMKINRNYYPALNHKSSAPRGFYQFALDSSLVIETMNQFGFSLVTHQGIGGLKGLKDEVALLKPLLQKLYDSLHKFARLGIRMIEPFLNGWAGHMSLLVLNKSLVRPKRKRIK